MFIFTLNEVQQRRKEIAQKPCAPSECTTGSTPASSEQPPLSGSQDPSGIDHVSLPVTQQATIA